MREQKGNGDRHFKLIDPPRREFFSVEGENQTGRAEKEIRTEGQKIDR